jgi:2-C-methyl-D-erythritol 2,4-cyclodiphosphate synthase
MKIGHGFDAHAFEEGGRLVLGGVEIPHDKGLAAHSDGDVVLHALCDALFGAAGMGDIGRHFSDSDAAIEGIDSRILLRRTLEQIKNAGLAVGNVDVTVVAQTPRLAPYVEAMNGNIAEDLGVAADVVNVKATTTEGMGFAGRSEGIAAFAVVLLNAKADS